MTMGMITETTKISIQNENVQKVLNDPKEEFDLVIAEWMFSDLPAGIAAVFNCPFVWVSSIDVHWMILQLIDEPPNPAYYANVISINIPPFTFWQRVQELYNQIKMQFMRYTSSEHSSFHHPRWSFVHYRNNSLWSTSLWSPNTGIPIIPVFGDQFLNVARAVNKGYALKVDLSYTMAGELKAAIEESTTNPKYTEVAKRLSFIYHDRPTTPGKELQHWVRHVIETGGAPHLRCPAISVPFYQKLCLDLLTIILVTLFVLVKLLKSCSSSLLKKTDSNKKNN